MLQHILTEGNSSDKNIENSSNLIINTIYILYLCFTSKMINVFILHITKWLKKNKNINYCRVEMF